MGRKDSARGPFAERCFLVGPFRSAASADAPLCREASSSSLVQMDVGLSALQLRLLVTSCLAGVCVTDLAAGWRVLVRPSNILTQPAHALPLREVGMPPSCAEMQAAERAKA